MASAAGNERPGTACLLGGTGFVGSRLAARLSRQGWRLRIPTRRSRPPETLRVLPGVRLFSADVHDPESLHRLLLGCDAVVNCVGILNERRRRDGSEFEQAHVQLVAKLLDAAGQAGVGKLVQISALQADAEQAPSHYLRSKGRAEQLIRTQAGPLRWTIFQPSVIFGPGDSFLNRFAPLLRYFPVLPLARAGALFAPVHVDDVVSAIDRALVDPATDGQTYQLCGPDTFSLRSILGLLANAMDRRCLILGLPDWLARLQALVLERLPGQLFTLDNFRSLSLPSVCSRDGLGALGISPRSLPAYLTATYRR